MSSGGGLWGENYRGRRLPLTLGLIAILPGAVAGAIVTAVVEASRGRSIDAGGWISIGASLLVLAAGILDDLRPIGPRGLRGHLSSLMQGHVSTGIVKMLVIVGCSVVVAAAEPIHPGATRVAGVALLAASANLWNGLDVRPGRAIKWFLVVAPVVLAAGLSLRLAPTFPGVVLGAAVALPEDLRERAMLGDGGSNLMGFTAGLGVYVALSGAAVWVAAAAVVALNVLAETVTLSRLIDASPPLRWFDRLGRSALPG
jgi:UDP-GlcNAc:undecaprenyl-phosphate GlcNAc-1-phosphate transferase